MAYLTEGARHDNIVETGSSLNKRLVPGRHSIRFFDEEGRPPEHIWGSNGESLAYVKTIIMPGLIVAMEEKTTDDEFTVEPSVYKFGNQTLDGLQVMLGTSNTGNRLIIKTRPYTSTYIDQHQRSVLTQNDVKSMKYTREGVMYHCLKINPNDKQVLITSREPREKPHVLRNRYDVDDAGELGYTCDHDIQVSLSEGGVITITPVIFEAPKVVGIPYH